MVSNWKTLVSVVYTWKYFSALGDEGLIHALTKLSTAPWVDLSLSGES